MEKQLEQKEFFLDPEGESIHVKLEFPEDIAEGTPLVLISHGLTGHMEERHIQAAARAAREAGYATLRAEFYGHGKSGGFFERHTVPRWVLQLMEVIDYARSLPWTGDLYLMGHSQGGLSVLLAGALKADQLKGLLLLSPALSIPDDARKGDVFGNRFDPVHVPDRVPIGEGRMLGGNYFRTAQVLPVEEALRSYPGPVLLVHGEADETIPVAYAKWAAEKCRQAKLVLVPDDDHCYNRHLDLVTEAVRSFLEGMR